jgi:uncharacterized membrane protein YeaQ/YmgE (transglycosylase-associated protein family)
MYSLFVAAEGGALVGGTMGIVLTLVIGGLIGWVASIVMKTNAQMGLLANIGVGIAGSFGGGYLAKALGIAAHGTIGGLLIALGGAVLLIIALRFLGIFK